MKKSGKPIKELEGKREKSLWLTEHAGLKSLSQAKRFMESVGIALRYWDTLGLPLASLYKAGMGTDRSKEEGHRKAIELTNQLLASFEAIEVNTIAGRISLVKSSLVPALYRLVTRGKSYDRTPKVSAPALLAYKMILDAGEITAGDLRKKMGIRGVQQQDPAYMALAELQKLFLVDRGPFKMPENGIPYLSKEGYPYHFFHEAHLDLVTESEKLTDQTAAAIFLSTYLRAAVFCPKKKMAAMFKLFLSAGEIETVLTEFGDQKKITLVKSGSDFLACAVVPRA